MVMVRKLAATCYFGAAGVLLFSFSKWAFSHGPDDSGKNEEESQVIEEGVDQEDPFEVWKQSEKLAEEKRSRERSEFFGRSLAVMVDGEGFDEASYRLISKICDPLEIAFDMQFHHGLVYFTCDREHYQLVRKLLNEEPMSSRYFKPEFNPWMKSTTLGD